MVKPALSIITVCFNVELTLRECLHSIVREKTSDIEYLVIDGASTDGTLAIVREYQEFIDLFVSEPDGGIFEAMNKGLLEASGEFVAFLNADDVYLPGAIAAILDAIYKGRAEVDVFYGDWIAVDANGVVHARRADHRLRYRYSLCHQAIAARRAIFPSPQGFDLRYRLCADFDLISRWQSEGARFRRLSQPLVRFSEAGASAKFIHKSAWESIIIALSRAQSPWVLVFAARIALYVARVNLISWARRAGCTSLKR